MNDDRKWKAYGPYEADDVTLVPVDGQQLAAIRKRKGFSQKKLANSSGVPLATLQKIEQNVVKTTRRGGLCCIANELQVRIDELAPQAQQPLHSIDAGELLDAAGSVVTVAREVNEILPAGSPHRSFLAQHWSSIVEAIEADTTKQRVSSFVAARDYKACLAALPVDDRRGICAFADLIDPIELRFWCSNPTPESTWVKERVFWVDWSTVHDASAFSRILHTLHTQSRYSPNDYHVRLGVLLSDMPTLSHPLGSRASGQHLLLMEPTLVGGYVRTTGGDEKNLMITDQQLYLRARNYYDHLKELSVAVSPEDDDAAIHRKLNGLHGVGDYDPAWGDHSKRPPRYFDCYEQNIRRWIPWYLELNLLCAGEIQHALWRRFLEARRPARILEIGFGTGGLTQHVLNWIDSASQLAQDAQDHNPIVEGYYGLDPAPQMFDRLPEALVGHRLCKFQRRSMFRSPEIRRHIANGRMDILCGSFVFHDIIDGKPETTIAPFLEDARNCLVDDGVLILADVFVSPDEEGRRKELSCWEAGMRARGMTDEQIETFRQGNPDMYLTASEEQLREVGHEYGFGKPLFMRLPHRGSEHVPFRVVVMHRMTRSKST